MSSLRKEKKYTNLLDIAKFQKSLFLCTFYSYKLYLVKKLISGPSFCIVTLDEPWMYICSASYYAYLL